MKSSEILLRAAELVDSGETYFACDAIFDADPANPVSCYRTQKLLRKFFRPKSFDVAWTGMEYVGWFGKDQQHRVLALLMCAAIAESEGD